MERRNEVDVLHVKMDVKSAQDFLAMVAEKGDAMVEVQDLLAFARPWITDWPEHLARLERTTESHDRCTQHMAQLRTGHFLQGVAHRLHTEHQQSQGAKELEECRCSRG